ncbi:MAG: OmpA family protein [Alistipes sp.]|nr:OmpA family protein [Alistipes sp.]
MKKITTAFFITVVSILAAKAQNHAVEIVGPSVDKIGDNVTVSFGIVPGKFPSDYSVTVTPVLFNGQGEFTSLEPVRLVGRKRYIYDRRTRNLSGDSRLVGKRSPVERYSATIPYRDWMQYVSVAVEQVGEGCCRQFEQPLTEVAAGQLLYYDIKPYFDVTPMRYELTELERYDLDNPFLHPMEDYDKRYDILYKDRDKGTSVVIFTVGSHQLDLGFQGNMDVLEAIGKAFELIESDPNAVLKHIMIAGYASPEGSLAFNTALADRRARSVKSYIQTLMTDPADHLFELYNGREDWDGLREKVEGSQMPSRGEVLEVIDGYTIEQQERKRKLRELHAGVPYAYMLENFYPALRSAGYVQVYYEIDRTATVATAVTDEQGRTTWIDPDSPRNRGVTAINKALGHMVDHRFDRALELLAEFSDDPRSWNHIGVCHMMCGDYDTADEYFRRAMQAGDENAARNMEQTMWARKVKL